VKLKKEHIERISRLILGKLKEKKLIEMRVGEDRIFHKIIDVVTSDLGAEDKLDRDARDLLDQYAAKAGGDIDRQQMLHMIKKQLAKERKMVL
jgi:hypothetical protein